MSAQNKDFSIDIMAVTEDYVCGALIADRSYGFAFMPLTKKVWTFDPPLRKNKLEIKAAIVKRILDQVYL